MLTLYSQVSSSYHPHAGLGYCPNLELMQFMSLATIGAYLQLAPQIDPSEPYLYEMNIYHEVSGGVRPGQLNNLQIKSN